MVQDILGCRVAHAGQQRWGIASILLHAGIGGMSAEYLMLGVVRVEQYPAVQTISVLAIFFVACAAFLDPLAAFLKSHLDGGGPQLGRARLSSGLVGIALALIFAGFNFTVGAALQAWSGKQWFFLLAHFLLLPLIPGVIACSWIAGARRGRATLYGLLGGFAVDALMRLILWLVTRSVIGNAARPDPAEVAAFAAVAGGIQAGFYSGIGGLAIDLTRASRQFLNLTVAVLASIGLWRVAYHFVGGAFQLPDTDVSSQFGVFLINFADYGGALAGLALCPAFVLELKHPGAVQKSDPPILLFSLVLLAADLSFFVLALNPQFDAVRVGIVLLLLSGLLWSIGTRCNQVWNGRLNFLAGVSAFGGSALTVSAGTICHLTSLSWACPH